MDAFFFIDKPTGITSFSVLREMRRILSLKKIGHTWTLDPLATGGLLIATGNYTKLIPYVEKDTKRYKATVMLDGVSPSYDSDTTVSFVSDVQREEFQKTITKEKIESIFKENFFWEIFQIPPKYSALKIDGKRALDRTLAGQEIEMKQRKVEILSYKIISFSYPELIVELEVSAGTYIRSIAHDLWELLWCGWYLSALRRTWVWKLDITLAIELTDLNREKSLDIQDIFWNRVILFQDEAVYKRLSDGQRVWGEYDFQENENIFLFDGNMVRYIVEYKDSVLHPRKKIV